MPVSERYKKPESGIKSESFNPITETVEKPRLSNDELSARLTEAGQARQQITELDTLREQSEELETLERERLRRLEVSQTTEQYKSVFREVQTSVASRHDRRTEVKKLIAEIDPVVNRIIQELDDIHALDIQDYQKLEMAHRTFFYSGGQNRWQDGKPDVSQPIPDSLSEWLRCTGGDENLRTISPYDDSSPLLKAITGSVKFIYYSVQQLRRLQAFGLNRFANFGRK